MLYCTSLKTRPHTYMPLPNLTHIRTASYPFRYPHRTLQVAYLLCFPSL